MLKIGNFSRIANVSIRLLHHYDEIGLFHPAFIDPETGYRYYQTAQIKDLNKILALRDLGLSLDQIKLYIDNDLSPDELRGMLLLKKSQLHQTLNEELVRLRRVEFRLKQLESDEDEAVPNDVIIKAIPAQRYISMRNRALPTNQFGAFLELLVRGLAERNIALPGTVTVLEHSETFPEDTFDLEVGYTLPEQAQLPQSSIVLGGNTLALRELPAVQQMATLLHVGPWGSGLRSYRALGQWIEQHGFEIAGATREVYMELARGEGQNNVVEFQLPVIAAERHFA